jgi:hypothetical protein
MAESGAVQHKQVCTQTSNKIWKRVSSLREEESNPVGSILVLMGKRKAKLGGPICDEQRHLKIRKWEDYLKEEIEIETEFEEFEMETETKNDMAEAVSPTTMSLISWNC